MIDIDDLLQFCEPLAQPKPRKVNLMSDAGMQQRGVDVLPSLAEFTLAR